MKWSIEVEARDGTIRTLPRAMSLQAALRDVKQEYHVSGMDIVSVKILDLNAIPRGETLKELEFLDKMFDEKVNDELS